MNWTLLAFAIIIFVAAAYIVQAIGASAQMIDQNIRFLHQAMIIYAAEIKQRLPEDSERAANILSRIEDQLDDIRSDNDKGNGAILDRSKAIYEELERFNRNQM